MIRWDDPDEEWRAPPRDWLAIPRGCIRLLLLLISLLICMIPFIILRFGQRVFGARHKELAILKFWGGIAVWCFGLRPVIHGKIKIKGGMITANHINFIDIPLIFSVVPGYMMAKSEIKHWFFIGWCARILGTEFVKRDPSATGRQVASLSTRIARGDRMVMFPEATTTDGQRVIPFRSSFFQSLAELDRGSLVQPLSLYYCAPANASQNFYGHWGESNLVAQIWATVCAKGLHRVDVIIGEPLPSNLDRKAMAQYAEKETRGNFIKLKEEYEARLAAQVR